MLVRIAFVAKNQQEIPKDYSIGVIAGYAAQAGALNREIQKRPDLDVLNIDCDTVHAFQGREVDVCIYSITRNNQAGNIGFLDDWRHLNVALSRARDYLVIVGGLHFCEMNEAQSPFHRVIEHISGSSEAEVIEWDNE